MNERLYKALNEKNALQRYLARNVLFGLVQRLGLHLTGDHFYEIIPNTRFVASLYRDEPRDLPGIDFRFEEVINRALGLVTSFGPEYAETVETYGFRESNIYFRGLDALMLYSVVRDLKPRKLVEVGQGFSTCIMLSALHRNVEESGGEVEFVSIDPYARFAPSKIPPAVRFQRIGEEIQRLDLQPVLKGCQFLFTDSSHVYKFGSDVEFQLTRLYPRLQPGTVLHIHDVFSPYNYPLDWFTKEKRFWNEQYMLECFLMFNQAFRTYLPVHWLSRNAAPWREAISRCKLPERFKFRGASFYVQRLSEQPVAQD